MSELVQHCSSFLLSAFSWQLALSSSSSSYSKYCNNHRLQTDIHLISAVDHPEYSHCCVFVLALCLTGGILADFTLVQTTNCHPLWYSPYLVIQDIRCGVTSLKRICLTTMSYFCSFHFMVMGVMIQYDPKVNGSLLYF